MLQPRLTTVPRKAAHTSIQTILSRILLTIPNSERCDYSYASSSYECTCPPGLTLAPDGQVCQGGGEVEVTTAEIFIANTIIIIKLPNFLTQGDDQAVADELPVVALVRLVEVLGRVRGGRDGKGEVRRPPS